MHTLLVLLILLAHAEERSVPHNTEQKKQSHPVAQKDDALDFIRRVQGLAEAMDTTKLEPVVRELKKIGPSIDHVPAAVFATALEDESFFYSNVKPILNLASDEEWEKFLIEKIDEYEKQKPKDEKFAKGLERTLNGFAGARYNLALVSHQQEKLRKSFKTLKTKLFGFYKRMTPTSKQFDAPPYSTYLESAVLLGDVRGIMKCRSIIEGAYKPGEEETKKTRLKNAERAAEALYFAFLLDHPELTTAAGEAVARVAPTIKAKPRHIREEWEQHVLEVHENYRRFLESQKNEAKPQAEESRPE